MRVLIRKGGCPPGGWEVGKRVSLEEEEAHHLRVRRAKDGDAVEILDGSGLRGTGRLVQAGKDWAVAIQSVQREEPRAELTLAVAAGDRERFAWMAEKAVELGVTSLVPLDTERTSGVASRLRATHIGKLRRVVLEATKQCGAAWAPRVDAPVALSEFVSRPVAGHAWLADGSGGTAPAGLDESPLSVVIGPEGGFTSEERTLLVDAGYHPVALGFHTLRFETAALAAAAVAATARMRGQHG